MNLTVNINIPEKLTSEGKMAAPLHRALVNPNDPEPSLTPLQGPPVSMLLFALTRATTVSANNQLMTPDQQDNLNSNRSLYDVYKGTGAGAVATGKNGIDVFKNFIAAYPQYLQTLEDAQGLFAAFKKFVTNAGLWDDTCDLKYSQLANIAQTDWLSL
jgi:hypothetical protein